MNTEVVVVSFETGYWAQVWQAETDAPFRLLLDPELAAYRAFGLEQSLWRSWGPKNLWYYAMARLSGRQAHTTGGDTSQLGGDFIVDAAGIIRLAYRSKDPTDRPAVASLLATLTQLQEYTPGGNVFNG
ncbi:MAG: AhpC/TSA family protein [Anaerolineae bacterium]|nr:AhpC/TSA family protein [Anaerolineae bacterium]